MALCPHELSIERGGKGQKTNKVTNMSSQLGKELERQKAEWGDGE